MLRTFLCIISVWRRCTNISSVYTLIYIFYFLFYLTTLFDLVRTSVDVELQNSFLHIIIYTFYTLRAQRHNYFRFTIIYINTKTNKCTFYLLPRYSCELRLYPSISLSWHIITRTCTTIVTRPTSLYYVPCVSINILVLDSERSEGRIVFTVFSTSARTTLTARQTICKVSTSNERSMNSGGTSRGVKFEN